VNATVANCNDGLCINGIKQSSKAEYADRQQSANCSFEVVGFGSKGLEAAIRHCDLIAPNQPFSSGLDNRQTGNTFVELISCHEPGIDIGISCPSGITRLVYVVQTTC
jgi:hypothetical protein